MRYLLSAATMITVMLQGVNAAQSMQNEAITAQPTACISAKFNSKGTPHWQDIALQLTNKCKKTVDFQNATVSFKSKSILTTDFWGEFSPLSYPDNALKITSQAQGGGKFLATFNLHFPSYAGSTSKLPAGKTITIRYGAVKDDHIEGTTNVYLGKVVGTGNIKLTNAAKPAGVAKPYALVHLTVNGQAVNHVNLPWGSSKTVTGLAVGSYAISVESIPGSSGTYQGTANPSKLKVVLNQTASTKITYALVKETGKISIKLAAQPNVLTGYTSVPIVLLTQKALGSSISKAVPWNSTTTVSQLKAGSIYSFTTAKISYKDYNCAPTFSPASVAAATTTPLTTLTYQCTKMTQDSVTIEIKGAPAFLPSLKITLTPNDGTAPVTEIINLTNGTGSSTLQLTEGSIYNVSADPVAGYTFNFSPQPLTVSANATETITLSPQAPGSGGKIIGYIPGWKTLPPAEELAAAGYTHVMIAFGVFSTSTPGEITPAFYLVTNEYIQSLHKAKIKVILSLGGASTSLSDTSVDFHEVLTMAKTPKEFTDKFIASLTNLFTTYGFDGFDIDIEHGINPSGTFANPEGDIAALATIINSMYAKDPQLLITLAPQIANMSANDKFDHTWGNYASLVMQTHKSLAWVGIQLYNAGCAYGIDKVCYDVKDTDSPNASVAMAVDLLADWPTGFNPYLASLTPSQIVLGYPSPNASGVSDGTPVTPNSTIIKAIECLKTQTSCGTYIPPKAYGAIGGVFNWEVTFDQSNGYKFAKELKDCVIKGVCN